MSDSDMTRLLELLTAHESRAQRSLNFTPSENVLSPLARLPFVIDTYSRYFFDHLRLAGEWFFFGGIDAGRIELEVLQPVLRDLARARYVDTRPISGLNCMTIAMAGLCPRGGLMLTVPVDSGGHMSTASVAARLGIRVLPLPMERTHFVDLERLGALLAAERPDLVYLDQSSQLFPIDPAPIRELIDARSPGTLLHCDSSHVNGLILGDALPNPLERGAHTFGGSTHKTLPGPHKGFLATNDAGLRDRIDAIAYHFISHQHLAASISLAITLIEMQECGGTVYAAQVLANAGAFARELADRGIPVAAAEYGFTRCHQVWAMPRPGVAADEVARRMYDQGLLVNKFNDLPGVDQPVLRISLAEVTRLGADEQDVRELAGLFAVLLSGDRSDHSAATGRIRARLSRPRYCYDYDQLAGSGASQDFLRLFRGIAENTGHRVAAP